MFRRVAASAEACGRQSAGAEMRYRVTGGVEPDNLAPGGKAAHPY